MNDIKPWRERFDVTGMSDAERTLAAIRARDEEIAELRAALAARATPAQPAPQWANDERTADEIVTALYRRFKDWSARGFGPEDVTWCEVKADLMSLITASAQPSPSSVGAAIRALPLPEADYKFGTKGMLCEDAWTADQVRDLLSEAAALAEQVQGQQVPELVSIDDMCAILKDMLIEADEYTDCNIVYKVTFDQLRALYMKGIAAAPSIPQDGQKSEGV